MYGSYTSSSLTLRAKWSFSYNHHYFLNDRVENCTSSCITETIPPSCTAFPIHGFPLNPRFLFGYCLRQSTLIQWSHSRRFVLGGAATGARYCRLTAHDIERDRRVPRLPKDRGRRGSSVSCRIRDSDESFQEILGLLAEVEGCYRESIGVEFGYSGRKLKGEDTIKAVNGEDRKCDSRENKHRARKDGLSSSYYSGSGYEDDVVEGEVQEVWKYEDDVRREGTNDSKYRERESSCRKGSERKIRDREEKVASSMDSARQAREEYIREEQHAVGQRELRGGSRKLTRVSEVSEDDTRRASSSKNLVNARNEDREERVYGWESDSRRDLRKESELREKDSNMRASSSQKVSEWKIRDREEKTASLMASAREAREEYIQEEQRRIGERESREGSQKLMRVSEAGEDDTKRASSFKNVVDSRREEREESSISAVKRHSEIDQRFVGLAESRKSSQKLTERLEIHDSKTERASNSQRRFDTRVEDKEDKTTIAQNLVQVARDRRTEMDIKKQYKSHTNVSGTHTSDTETASSSQRLLDSGTDDQEECLGSGANLGYGVNEQQNQTDERVPRPLRSKKEFEKNTSLSEHSRSNIERVSNTQKITSTRMDNQEENVSSISVQGLKEKGIGTHSEERRTSLSTQRETASSGNLDSNSSYVYPHFHELDDQTRKDEMYLVKNDALESARRLDNSSALYVGEFVDQVQQEISTSDELDVVSRRYSGVQMEEVHGGTSQTTTGLQQSVVDATTKNIDERYIKESARQSSATSGLKGPSDEMWDVHGFSSQERSRVEPEEDSSAVGVVDSTTSLTNSENDITRRSHRSLWTSIADIIRKGWGSRGESHNLTLQSGIRSSSNESLSSEAWFSGHELDENDDDSDKKERSSTPKESVPINRPIDQSHPKAHPVPSRGASKMTRSEDRITKLEADTSTSMGTTKRASASKGASPVNPPENIRLIKRERGRQGSPNIVTVDQSSTLVGGAASHTIEEEVINIGNIQMPGSGIIISKEESIREKLPEVGGTDGKDGELKRRKLQRNKQVLKEQFDEWEEAYKFESEQRKIDEIFMREALLEAKKAADTWEVPVGAVLVQNGKIIARGRNLVEELRDSTAHAEMICIREASNLLRTWRLAETTLYVTLEPCAMCAGAILQARVDAVVWGAPNKLLGADGSWVRLFPGGDGGRNSLDPSTETAGPVHPFHPKITIRRGILSTECSDVMQQFFQLRRKKDKKPEPPPPSCLPISTHPTKLVTKMHDLFSMMFCL